MREERAGLEGSRPMRAQFLGNNLVGELGLRAAANAPVENMDLGSRSSSEELFEDVDDERDSANTSPRKRERESGDVRDERLSITHRMYHLVRGIVISNQGQNADGVMKVLDAFGEHSTAARHLYFDMMAEIQQNPRYRRELENNWEQDLIQRRVVAAEDYPDYNLRIAESLPQVLQVKFGHACQQGAGVAQQAMDRRVEEEISHVERLGMTYRYDRETDLKSLGVSL